MELKTSSAVYLIWFQQELAPIYCDRLNASCVDSYHDLWHDPMRNSKGWKSSFCCPGILHALLVMLLECQVSINTDTQPVCCFCVASYSTLSDFELWWQLQPEDIVVGLPACEQCRLWVAVSYCSPHQVAHWILFSLNVSSYVTTWLILLPVSTQLSSFPHDCHSTQFYTSPHWISPVVRITHKIRNTGETCGTPACTAWFIMVLTMIEVSTIFPETKLSVWSMRSPFIWLAVISLTSLSVWTLWNATMTSIRSTPGMSPFIHPAGALLTKMATASMAPHPMWLPNCPLCSTSLDSASSDSCCRTTFSTSVPMWRRNEIVLDRICFVQSSLPRL